MATEVRVVHFQTYCILVQKEKFIEAKPLVLSHLKKVALKYIDLE